ncbi:hypothetical protein E2542_SST30265 [Spatholobus suberectus]|nr:hypothetical protein E2542_SST30265 [Spatholobus suberectus]
MNGGGGDLPPPPANGGEFLLSLIQRPHPPQPHQPPPPPQSPAIDPAVAAIGPTIHVAARRIKSPAPITPSTLTLTLTTFLRGPTLSFLLRTFTLQTFSGCPITRFPIEDANITNTNANANANNNNKINALVQQQELKLQFGSLPTVAYSASEGNHDVLEKERRGLGGYRASGLLSPETSRVPPGFENKNRGKGLEGRKDRNENLYGKREGVRMVSGERSNVRGNVGLVDQLDRPRPPAGSNLHSGLANETGIGVVGVRDGKHKGGGRLRVEGVADSGGSGGDVFVLGERLADSLLVEDESDDRANSRQRRGAREKVNSLFVDIACRL